MRSSTSFPANSLLSAALLGLTGVTSVGCDTKAADSSAAVSDATGDGSAADANSDAACQPNVPTRSESYPAPKDLTFAKFVADCKATGGYVQTHASCSGAAAGRGLSINKFDGLFTPHTCRGLNTCGGATCLDLPTEATTAGGAEIYAHHCADCHGTEAFKVFFAKGTDGDAHKAAFAAKSESAIQNVVVFGTRGYVADGSSFSNMPTFVEKLSRGEVERVSAFIRTLPVVAEEYTTLGVDEEFDFSKP